MINYSPNVFGRMIDALTCNTEKKIRDLALLQEGWHFGEGSAISQETIATALNLHQVAIELAFYTTNAFPGLDGQVVVAAYESDHYFEFTIGPDKNCAYLHLRGDEEISDIEGLSLADAKRYLKDFRIRQWKQFGSSQGDTTTTESSGALPSRTTRVAYQSLRQTAW